MAKQAKNTYSIVDYSNKDNRATYICNDFDHNVHCISRSFSTHVLLRYKYFPYTSRTGLLQYIHLRILQFKHVYTTGPKTLRISSLNFYTPTFSRFCFFFLILSQIKVANFYLGIEIVSYFNTNATSKRLCPIVHFGAFIESESLQYAALVIQTQFFSIQFDCKFLEISQF